MVKEKFSNGKWFAGSHPVSNFIFHIFSLFVSIYLLLDFFINCYYNSYKMTDLTTCLPSLYIDCPCWPL